MDSITHLHVAAKYIKDVSSTLISPRVPLDESFHAAEPAPWWGASALRDHVGNSVCFYVVRHWCDTACVSSRTPFSLCVGKTVPRAT